MRYRVDRGNRSRLGPHAVSRRQPCGPAGAFGHHPSDNTTRGFEQQGGQLRHFGRLPARDDSRSPIARGDLTVLPNMSRTFSAERRCRRHHQPAVSRGGRHDGAVPTGTLRLATSDRHPTRDRASHQGPPASSTPPRPGRAGALPAPKHGTVVHVDEPGLLLPPWLLGVIGEIRAPGLTGLVQPGGVARSLQGASANSP